MNSDPTTPHPDPPCHHFTQTLQERPFRARQLQEGHLSQCMIQCQIHHRCTTRRLSPNATRHLHRLSRSIPRCMTLCLIRHLNQNAAAPPMDL